MNRILVTGSPRNGTTPLGSFLVHLTGGTEIYEPFNPDTGVARAQDRIPFVLPADLKCADHVTDVAMGRIPLRTRSSRNHRRVSFLGRTMRTLWAARLSGPSRDRIWKDPFASLIASDALNVGYTVFAPFRPPAGVAASYLRLGWAPGYQLQMMELVTNELGVTDLDLSLIQRAGSSAQIATAIWYMVYESLIQKCAGHDRFMFVNMRAVAEDPASAYARVAHFLNPAISQVDVEGALAALNKRPLLDIHRLRKNAIHRKTVSHADVSGQAQSGMTEEDKAYISEIESAIYGRLDAYWRQAG